MGRVVQCFDGCFMFQSGVTGLASDDLQESAVSEFITFVVRNIPLFLNMTTFRLLFDQRVKRVSPF
jgi:hypothetical protein